MWVITQSDRLCKHRKYRSKAYYAASLECSNASASISHVSFGMSIVNGRLKQIAKDLENYKNKFTYMDIYPAHLESSNRRQFS